MLKKIKNFFLKFFRKKEEIEEVEPPFIYEEDN